MDGIENFFEFIDDHSGSVMALTTVVLVGVTAAYVVLTQRLVRTQHIGTKREIVEKIYRPLAAQLESTLWGEWPILTWDRLRESEPFLAYHHLIPSQVRRQLDDLGASAEWAQERYGELSRATALGVAALARLNVPPDHTFKAPRVNVDCWRESARETLRLGLHEILLARKGPTEVLRYYKIDEAPSLKLEIMDRNEVIQSRAIDMPEMLRVIKETMAKLAEDAASSELIEQYRTRLAKLDRLHDLIGREIKKGSRV